MFCAVAMEGLNSFENRGDHSHHHQWLLLFHTVRRQSLKFSHFWMLKMLRFVHHLTTMMTEFFVLLLYLLPLPHRRHFSIYRNSEVIVSTRHLFELEVIQSLSTNLNEINFYFSCCWTPKWTPSIHTVVERVLLLDCFRVKVRLSELRAPKTKYNDRPSQAVTRDRYVMCTNKRTEQLLICVSFHADIVRSKICIQLYLNIQQSFKLHKDQSIVSY